MVKCKVATLKCLFFGITQIEYQYTLIEKSVCKVLLTIGICYQHTAM